MKRICIYYFVILIFLINTRLSYSNQATLGNNYKISKLSEIPQNDINDIYQDSRGFIWIGTLDGLHRFDGYGYKSYRTSNDKNTINSNMISAIDEDSHGNIWISTYDKGICKLNPKTDKITDFSNKITEADNSSIFDTDNLFIDDNDVLWLTYKNNIVRVTIDQNMDKVKETRILFETNSEAQAIYLDSKGELWIGASHQLIRVLNPHTTQDNIKFESYNIHVQDICESENEIIALGAELYIFKRTANTTTSQYSLKSYPEIYGSSILYDNNRLWIGGRNGLKCYNRELNSGWITDNSFNSDFGSQGLGSNVVFSLMLDSISGIWVGTRGSGINVINLNPKLFSHYKKTTDPNSLSNDIVRSVFQDSYGQVWIGTEEKGVNILKDPTSESFDSDFIHLSVNNKGIADRVYTAKEMPTPGSREHKSIIWLGTSYYAGIVGVNPHTYEIVNKLNEVGFTFTAEVYDSMLWVGTYRNGLWCFIMNDEGKVISSKQFMPGDYEGSVNSDNIRYLLKDSKNNLWVGTDKGLHRVEPEEITNERPTFKDYTNITSNSRFGFDYVLQIYEDHVGRIWVGTMGNGLLFYNQGDSDQEVSFGRITTENRLPSNTIKSIVEDNDGYLWLATNYGISRFHADSLMVTNYDVDDGLQANEFSEICATKLNDGRIIMGGINGFNVFSPKEIATDNTPPKLYLSELYVNNKLILPEQKINGRILLESNIEFLDYIQLKYGENSFSLGFIGIQHNSPNKNNYKYILEGFDKEWLSTSSQIRMANYTNIPPGRYTFKVNCSNSDNLWCENPVELAIHIMPPFYLSWMAYFVYLVIATLSTYFIWQYRKNKEKERYKLLMVEMDKKQVEEISQMRQLFFTNISHEFKTPLTLIKGPVDSLLNNPNTPTDKRVESYKMIKKNVRIMMRLISQLMDFRRIDEDNLKLKFSKVEVNEFVEAISKSFISWAAQKNIKLSFKGTAHNFNTAFDTNKMEIVLYNVISNAIKYTPEYGKIKVNVEISTDEKYYSIIISDTGVGISDKDKDRIFERFFQASDVRRRKAGSTGIGLAHAKALVEKMNGKISFESKVDQGTTFSIELPVKNEEAVIFSEKVLNVEEEIKLVQEKPAHLNQAKKVTISSDKKSILIVEDNYDLRYFVADEFTEEYNVVMAEDGEQGLEMAKKYNPDIIISDIMMPNMDGIEMCHCIKTLEQTSHIPVVLLTAKSSEEAMIKGYSTNADAYITKPFSTEVLKERVRAILNNREALKLQYQKEIKINPMIIANSETDVRFMEKVLKLIEDNLSDPEFNVEKLALAFGVSRSYLSRKLKALTGESAIQFQRSTRLKHAAEYISSSSLNISEIAWQVGYNDIDTFRERFREHFHMNPSEYRQRHKKKYKND